MPKSKKRPNRKAVKSPAQTLRSEMKRTLREMGEMLHGLQHREIIPPPEPANEAQLELEYVREMVLPDHIDAAMELLGRQCDPYLLVVNLECTVDGDPFDHEEDGPEVLHPQYTAGGRPGLTAEIDRRLKACDLEHAVGCWFVPFEPEPDVVLPVIYLRHVKGDDQVFIIRDNGELVYQAAKRFPPQVMLDEIVSRFAKFEEGVDLLFHAAVLAISADPVRSRAFAEQKDWRDVLQMAAADPTVIDCIAGLTVHGMGNTTPLAFEMAEEMTDLREELSVQMDAANEHVRESLEGAEEAARKRFAAELEKRDMLVRGATARAEKLQSDLSALRAAAPEAAAPKSVPNATPPDQLALALADLFR